MIYFCISLVISCIILNITSIKMRTVDITRLTRYDLIQIMIDSALFGFNVLLLVYYIIRLM